MSQWGHQRRFKRKPRAFASAPIPDISLRRIARRPNRLTHDEARRMMVNFAGCRSCCGGRRSEA